LIDIEDEKAAQDLLRNMEETRQQISDRIQKRAVVFPSGIEIQKGLVQDTNTPYIKKRLTEEDTKYGSATFWRMIWTPSSPVLTTP